MDTKFAYLDILTWNFNTGLCGLSLKNVDFTNVIQKEINLIKAIGEGVKLFFQKITLLSLCTNYKPVFIDLQNII